MKKLYLISILFILWNTGCKMIHPSRMFSTDKDFEYSEFDHTRNEYKIKPFDKFNLRVYTNKGYILVDNSGGIQRQNRNALKYTVEFDGNVKVPTLGRIKLSGYTIREAEQFLEQEYKKYYKEPFVMIKVTNRRVLLFKSGGVSGNVINLENENYTLIEALASSGGISDMSKAYKIKLIRGDLNDPDIYVFNIRSVKDMKKANFLLEANDIIYVETRPRYASRLLSEISPYLNLLTTGLLVYSLFAK